jgi:hypothetical protein
MASKNKGCQGKELVACFLFQERTLAVVLCILFIRQDTRRQHRNRDILEPNSASNYQKKTSNYLQQKLFKHRNSGVGGGNGKQRTENTCRTRPDKPDGCRRHLEGQKNSSSKDRASQKNLTEGSKTKWRSNRTETPINLGVVLPKDHHHHHGKGDNIVGTQEPESPCQCVRALQRTCGGVERSAELKNQPHGHCLLTFRDSIHPFDRAGLYLLPKEHHHGQGENRSYEHRSSNHLVTALRSGLVATPC